MKEPEFVKRPMDEIVSAARAHEFASIALERAVAEVKVATESLEKKRLILAEAQAAVNAIETRISNASAKLVGRG